MIETVIKQGETLPQKVDLDAVAVEDGLSNLNGWKYYEVMCVEANLEIPLHLIDKNGQPSERSIRVYTTLGSLIHAGKLAEAASLVLEQSLCSLEFACAVAAFKVAQVCADSCFTFFFEGYLKILSALRSNVAQWNCRTAGLRLCARQ